MLYRLVLCLCAAVMLTATTQAQVTLPGGQRPLTQKERVRLAIKAGDYLESIIQKDGRFIYTYSPRSGKPGTDYNWLRHCGTVMSLCQLYETIKNDKSLTVDEKKKYLTGAEKAIPVFLKQINDVTIGDKTYKGVISPGFKNGKAYSSVKTGGCALAAIALMKYDDAKKVKANKDTVLGLCKFIVQTQMKSGELRSKFIVEEDSSESHYSSFRSLFYQGEALLALAMAQERYPVKDNQVCMLRLLNYLAYEWAANLDRAKKEMFDHWGMIGLSRAYEMVNKADMVKYHAEYLELMTKSVKKMQDKLKTDIPHYDRVLLGRRLMNVESRRSVIASKGPMDDKKLLTLGYDYCENELLGVIRESSNRFRGSFRENPGRVCPTATRIEGISAVATLIMGVGENKYQPRVKDWVRRVDLARRFMKKCQYTEKDQKRFKSPMSIVGGLRDHLDWTRKDYIRIDFCQHSISAWLGW